MAPPAELTMEAAAAAPVESAAAAATAAPAKAAAAAPVFDLKALVRPNVWALQPYRCARDDYSTGVLLDANENPYGPVVTPPAGVPADLERYPDPLFMDVKARIAAYRNVDPHNVFLGVGSDECIDLTVRIFCQPGRDKILICPPTYPMYKVAADANDVGVVRVPLTPDFALQPEAVIAAVAADPAVKIVFLCSPNNPTGNDMARDAVVRVLEGCADRIVVVDEAYVDFSPAGSTAPLVRRYPNLIALQTMSKSFGLAGIRLGMAFASTEIVDVFNRIKAPYSINKLSAAIGAEAWSPAGLARMEASVARLREERAWTMEQLAKVPGVLKLWPSTANFFLVKIPDAYNVYKEMADAGVVTRFRGNELHCDGALRVSVGTHEQNELLVQTLAAALAKRVAQPPSA